MSEARVTIDDFGPSSGVCRNGSRKWLLEQDRADIWERVRHEGVPADEFEGIYDHPYVRQVAACARARHAAETGGVE